VLRSRPASLSQHASPPQAMCKWYKIPVLLIEFGEGKPFELQSPEDAGKDKDLVPKLSVLVIHFPRLRILWSRSAHATATLFEDLMSEAQPIDVDYSLAAGVAGKGSTPSDGSENSAAVRFLKKLPGVEDGNFRAIMRKVRCVADLCNLSRGELKEVLGEINSRRLHKVLTWQMPM
jgi:DNA excision repair protein ERCC-4